MSHALTSRVAKWTHGWVITFHSIIWIWLLNASPSIQCREKTILWRHNRRDGISNQQPHDCLLNRPFRRRSKKTSELRVTGHCGGNSPVTGEFPAQMASNAENVSISWRHHDIPIELIRWTSRSVASVYNKLPRSCMVGRRPIPITWWKKGYYGVLYHRGIDTQTIFAPNDIIKPDMNVMSCNPNLGRFSMFLHICLIVPNI